MDGEDSVIHLLDVGQSLVTDTAKLNRATGRPVSHHFFLTAVLMTSHFFGLIAILFYEPSRQKE